VNPVLGTSTSTFAPGTDHMRQSFEMRGFALGSFLRQIPNVIQKDPANG